MAHHLYLGVQNENLTGAQWRSLLADMKAMGMDNDNPRPMRRNHWRTRLDNRMLIFEAVWNMETMAADWFKEKLAAILGVAVGDIGHSASSDDVGYHCTFSHPDGVTDLIYLLIFGYSDETTTYRQSQNKTRAYLRENAADWEVND